MWSKARMSLLSPVHIVWLLLWMSPAQAEVDTSVLAPPTLSDDNGNSANQNSKLVFSRIPDSNQYASTSDTLDDKGLAPLHAFANSFSRSGFPSDYPYELVRDLVKGNLEFTSQWQSMSKNYLGFVIALALGLVFVLLFPIVGCCFCCCRACGNCGGNRNIKSETERTNKKATLIMSAVLLVLSLFILTGCALIFASNNRVPVALDELRDNSINSLDDLDIFLNQAVNQTKRWVTENFNFTKAVMFRDLDNIGYLLGRSVRDDMKDALNLSVIFSQVNKLSSTVDRIVGNLEEYEQGKDSTQEAADKYNIAIGDFASRYRTVVNTLSAAEKALAPSEDKLKAQWDSSKLPNVTDQKNKMKEAQARNITQLAADANANLNDIPGNVQNDSKKQIEDLKSRVNNYSTELDPIKEKLENVQSDFDDFLNLEDLKQDADEYLETAQNYSQYVWYGFIGLASIYLVIAVLFVLGVMCGIFGGSTKKPPHKRGALSNCGGNTLIAAVAFVFIFGWLTMLMTTMLFMVSAPSEYFICRPLKDLSIADRLLNEYEIAGKLGGSKTYLASQISEANDSEMDLTLEKLMNACERDTAMYVAFDLEAANIFNLTEVTDYKSTFDVDKELSNINVDFSSVSVYTPELQAAFADIENGTDLDFNTMLNLLTNESLLLEPAKEFARDLNAYIPTLNTSSQSTFTTLQKELDTILTTEGHDLLNTTENLTDVVHSLEDDIKGDENNVTLNDEIQSLREKLKTADQLMDTKGDEIVQMSLQTYSQRITGIIDEYIERLKFALNNEIGNCKPLANLYNSVIVGAICDLTINTFNGLWFSVGWTLFFCLPAIIIGVKLAKYFRRMNLCRSENNSTGPSKSSLRSRSSVHPTSNVNSKSRIVPSDEPDYSSFEEPAFIAKAPVGTKLSQIDNKELLQGNGKSFNDNFRRSPFSFHNKVGAIDDF